LKKQSNGVEIFLSTWKELDEDGAADLLLELIQFQEAYVASGNFRKKNVFMAEQINQELEFS
jgi:hypothetical protein